MIKTLFKSTSGIKQENSDAREKGCIHRISGFYQTRLDRMICSQKKASFFDQLFLTNKKRKESLKTGLSKCQSFNPANQKSFSTSEKAKNRLNKNLNLKLWENPSGKSHYSCSVTSL